MNSQLSTEEPMIIAPAGWFEDPIGLPVNRWWNGTDWTEHTAAIPGRTDAAAAVPIDTDASAASPAQMWAKAPTRWNTLGAFGVSATPWVWLAASAAAIALFAVQIGGGLASLAVLLVPIIWMFVAAARDRRALWKFGFQKRASMLWLLFGPFFYLLVRTIRVRREAPKGAAPLIALVINSALIAIVSVGAAVAAAPVVNTKVVGLVEAHVYANLANRGGGWEASCPSNVLPLLSSGAVTCSVTHSVGGVLVDAGTVAVSLTPAGHFSYTYSQ